MFKVPKNVVLFDNVAIRRRHNEKWTSGFDSLDPTASARRLTRPGKFDTGIQGLPIDSSAAMLEG
jgi:hypothetical protein